MVLLIENKFHSLRLGAFVRLTGDIEITGGVWARAGETGRVVKTYESGEIVVVLHRPHKGHSDNDIVLSPMFPTGDIDRIKAEQASGADEMNDLVLELISRLRVMTAQREAVDHTAEFQHG